MLENINHYISEWLKCNNDFLRTLKINLRHKKKKNIIYDKNFVREVHEESAPVFILSTGRCGTKYLTEIFKLFTCLDVHHSTKPELIYYSKYAYENNDTSLDELKHIIDASRLERIQETYMRNRIYIETNNRITFFAYALADLYPKSKFIHLVRHPGDFVRSGILRNWYSGEDNHNQGRIVPKNPQTHWDEFSNIEKISWLWNETNQFIEIFKQKLNDRSRILTVKAENLFGNKEEIIKTLDFMSVFVTDNKIFKRELNKKVNAQRKSNYPNYQSWEQNDKDSLQKQIKINDIYNYSI